jgi:hypothetical protein
LMREKKESEEREDSERDTVTARETRTGIEQDKDRLGKRDRGEEG